MAMTRRQHLVGFVLRLRRTWSENSLLCATVALLSEERGGACSTVQTPMDREWQSSRRRHEHSEHHHAVERLQYLSRSYQRERSGRW